MDDTLKYGISIKKFELIKDALDMQSIFGFTENQNEAAFNIAEKYNVSMQSAFEFIDDYSVQFLTDDDGNYTDNQKELMFLSTPDKIPPLLYSYFYLGQSIDGSFTLIKELAANGVQDITSEEFELIEEYLDSELNYNELRNYFNHYKSVPNSNFIFRDVMENIELGLDIETAISELVKENSDNFNKEQSLLYDIAKAESKIEEPIWAEDDKPLEDDEHKMEKTDRYNDDLYYDPDEDDDTE